MSKMTTKARRRKLEECGTGAFGDASGPKARKAGRPRYPLVKGGCELSCKAAKDAFRRARQQHENKIAKRIRDRAKRHGCPWAE